MQLPQVDVGEEEPIVEIEIDPFLDTVMRAWIDTQQEGSRHLNETFHKYDEDGDGMLSLKEFTGMECCSIAGNTLRCISTNDMWRLVGTAQTLSGRSKRSRNASHDP